MDLITHKFILSVNYKTVAHAYIHTCKCTISLGNWNTNVHNNSDRSLCSITKLHFMHWIPSYSHKMHYTLIKADYRYRWCLQMSHIPSQLRITYTDFVPIWKLNDLYNLCGLKLIWIVFYSTENSEGKSTSNTVAVTVESNEGQYFAETHIHKQIYSTTVHRHLADNFLLLFI